ncbi:MAG: N-acetylglucosamine-6-phosphate deacetylase [Cohaesibacter sp.]|nr:N-acetylglucosamine-6-phosphate deacetylase [Cohaesibacter sp.]
MKQLLIHARLFDGDVFHAGKAVLLDGMSIEDIIDSPSDLSPYLRQHVVVHDLKGLVLCPGFVDLQVNGGNGVMLGQDCDLSALETMIDAHRQFGTTSLLPTLISDHWQVMEHISSLIRQAHRHWGENSSLSAVKGVHFEGPYLNVARKGVHDADIIRPVDADGVQAALDLLGHPDLGVRLVTLAPEMVDASFITDLVARGVLVSAGHSAATYQQSNQALRAGVSAFTHLFNAMTPLGSREPGMVGAALDASDAACGLIVDGFHVHPASLRMAIAAKEIRAGKGKIFLVTDAMASVGMQAKEDGSKSFDLHGEHITARHGICKTHDGVLAGSDLTMIGAVRNCVELLDLPLSEALRMASLYPARYIRMDKVIGRVASGFAADLVAFDPASWSVRHSWINGYERRYS